MNNQNPQEILNEILLRMKYDSSKTLSENREIILEQGGYYYTPSGKLVGYPGTNNSNIPAKDIYPNITNNQYPQTADFNKIQTALAGRNINKIVSQMPKTQTTQIPKFEKPQIPQSDYLGPGGRFQQQFPEYDPKQQEKLTPVLKQKEQLKNIESLYQRELAELKKQFGVGTKKMVSPYGSGLSGKELDDYIIQYQKNLGSCAYYPDYCQEVKKLNDKYGKTKFASFNEYGDVDLPKNSKVSYFTYEDFNSVDSIKKSFITKLTDDELRRFTNSPKGLYQSGNVSKNGDLYQWIFSKIKDTVKDFILPPPYDEYVWKKNLYVNNEGNYEISKKYYFKSNDRLIPYDKLRYGNASFIEEYGALILNGVSIIVSVLGKGNLIAYLASLGLDLVAAKIQSDSGDSSGALLSTILAFTPFASFGIKVSPSEATNLAKKFANASTKSDVANIFKTLTDEELKIMDALSKTGNLEKVINSVKNTNAQNKIKELVKSSPVKSNIIGQKIGAELGVTGLALYSLWDTLDDSEIQSKTRLEMFDLIFNSLSLDQNLTENEKNQLKTNFEKLFTAKKFKNAEEILDEIKKKRDIVNKLKEKTAKEKYNTFLEKITNGLDTTINNMDNEIDLSGMFDVELKPDEKNLFINADTTQTNK
jgi:hypothetical protein